MRSLFVAVSLDLWPCGKMETSGASTRAKVNNCLGPRTKVKAMPREANPQKNVDKHQTQKRVNSERKHFHKPVLGALFSRIIISLIIAKNIFTIRLPKRFLLYNNNALFCITRLGLCFQPHDISLNNNINARLSSMGGRDTYQQANSNQ